MLLLSTSNEVAISSQPISLGDIHEPLLQNPNHLNCISSQNSDSNNYSKSAFSTAGINNYHTPLNHDNVNRSIGISPLFLQNIENEQQILLDQFNGNNGLISTAAGEISLMNVSASTSASSLYTLSKIKF